MNPAALAVLAMVAMIGGGLYAHLRTRPKDPVRQALEGWARQQLELERILRADTVASRGLNATAIRDVCEVAGGLRKDPREICTEARAAGFHPRRYAMALVGKEELPCDGC